MNQTTSSKVVATKEPSNKFDFIDTRCRLSKQIVLSMVRKWALVEAARGAVHSLVRKRVKAQACHKDRVLEPSSP